MRRADGARRRRQHRQKFRERARRQQHRLVTGDGRHAGKGVHALRPRNARNGIQAEAGHAPARQHADQFGIAQRRQEADQRLAFREPLRLRARHRADAHQAVRVARQLAGIGAQLRPGGGELGVGNAGRPARAALHRHGMLLFEQHFDRVGNERDPGFAILRFVKNSKSHLLILNSKKSSGDNSRTRFLFKSIVARVLFACAGQNSSMVGASRCDARTAQRAVPTSEMKNFVLHPLFARISHLDIQGLATLVPPEIQREGEAPRRPNFKYLWLG